jgi:ADP-ribosylation factor-like protein 2
VHFARAHSRNSETRQALALPSIKTHHWRIQACSAITGEHVKGLEEGLDWVVTDVAQRLYWGSVEIPAPVIPEKSTSVV